MQPAIHACGPLQRLRPPCSPFHHIRHGTVETNTAPSHAWVPGSRLDLSLVTRQILTGVHMVLITLGATGAQGWRKE